MPDASVPILLPVYLILSYGPNPHQRRAAHPDSMKQADEASIRTQLHAELAALGRQARKRRRQAVAGQLAGRWLAQSIQAR